MQIVFQTIFKMGAYEIIVKFYLNTIPLATRENTKFLANRTNDPENFAQTILKLAF